MQGFLCHSGVCGQRVELVVDLSLSLSLVQGSLCNSGSCMINVLQLGGFFGVLFLLPLRLEMARVTRPPCGLCSFAFIRNTHAHLCCETQNEGYVHVHQLRHNIWIAH